MRMARTNLSIDRQVFDAFAAEAARRNMTLFAFANESLSAVASISAEGGDPAEFLRVWRILAILRQVDVITLPSDFIEDMIEQLFKANKSLTLAKFRELGSSLVGLLKMASENVMGLTALAKDFGFIIPIKQFKLTALQKGVVQVDVVGAGKGMETTECSSEFLKSVLGGYGFSITKSELHPGTIRLLAQERTV